MQERFEVFNGLNPSVNISRQGRTENVRKVKDIVNIKRNKRVQLEDYLYKVRTI
jgi:hypothetical protein